MQSADRSEDLLLIRRIVNPVVSLALVGLFAVLLYREGAALQQRWPSSWMAAGWRIDPDRVSSGSRIATLNRLMPSFERWPVEGAELDEYIRYYERVIEYMPQNSEALGVLGVLYFHRGREEAAEAVLQKAVLTDPSLFWPAHNLGVIYFGQGRYREAASLFIAALSASPQSTLETAYASRAYRPLIGNKGPEELASSLLSGYQECHALAAVSQALAKKEDPGPIRFDPKINLRFY